MSLFILPYHPASRAAKALSDEGDFKRIRRESSRFQPGPDKSVFNYGNSKPPSGVQLEGSPVFNSFEAVKTSSDKIKFFQAMSEGDNRPRIPDWTTEAQTALDWFSDKQDIMARRLLKSSGGDGIVFFSDQRNLHGSLDGVLDFPLFVKYKKKTSEFRIHYLRGRDGSTHLVDQQKKVLRRTDAAGNPIQREETDFRIRNHSRGFIFQRNDIDIPSDVLLQASLAFEKSGLDYGAVDVIYNQKENQAYVLEINTAPGLEGTTVENLVRAIREHWL